MKSVEERFRKALLEGEECLLEMRANIEIAERDLANQKAATVDAEIKFSRLASRARHTTRKRHVSPIEKCGPIASIRDGHRSIITEPTSSYPPLARDLKNGYRDPDENPLPEDPEVS